MYLLIIRCPDAAGDLTLQVYLGGPVSLSTHWADQHEAVPVRDEGLSSVMWPSEVTHLEGVKCSPSRHLRIHTGHGQPACEFAFLLLFKCIFPRSLLLTWAPLSFTSSTDHLPSYWIHTKIPPSISQVASFWKGSFQRTKTTYKKHKTLPLLLFFSQAQAAVCTRAHPWLISSMSIMVRKAF